MSIVELPPRQAVQALYSDHHGWLCGWLRKRIGDGCEAADMAQDTFLSIMTDGTAAEIREPRPFLVTIARRLMSHRHRRRLLEASYLEMLAALPEELAPSPEVRLLALERCNRSIRRLTACRRRSGKRFCSLIWKNSATPRSPRS